jgi:hypothetical protein
MADLVWEDTLLERKVESDLKDILKTMVAFANSVRPDHVGVIIIGEKDDGTVVGVNNPDNIQKRVREEAEKIYPEIVWRSLVYDAGGKKCVKVEIEHSGDTPHFGGPAWVRRGSETIKATEEVFQRLIDVRTDLVRELAKWIDKEVTVFGDQGSVPPDRQSLLGTRVAVFGHRWPTNVIAVLRTVNRHWVTLERKDNAKNQSEPLKKLTLSFDDERGQLKIIVSY